MSEALLSAGCKPPFPEMLCLWSALGKDSLKHTHSPTALSLGPWPTQRQLRKQGSKEVSRILIIAQLVKIGEERKFASLRACRCDEPSLVSITASATLC